MNDKKDFEDIEIKDLSNEDIEQSQKEKKEQEISIKRKQAFPLSQSKDRISEDSAWGNYIIRNSDSLEIMENEPYYRTPLTNIIESDIQFQLFIELPGLDKKNVKITLQEGILELKGDLIKKDKDKKDKDKDKKDKDKDKKDKDKEKKDKDKDKKDKDKEKKDKDKEKKDKKKEKFREIKGSYLRREFKSPSFFRAFILPEDILSEDIDASFRNGVLRLNILKTAAIAKQKHVIDIK